jgi:hypothetical protein
VMIGQRRRGGGVRRYCHHRPHDNISCDLPHQKKGKNPSLIWWFSNLSTLACINRCFITCHHSSLSFPLSIKVQPHK